MTLLLFLLLGGCSSPAPPPGPTPTPAPWDGVPFERWTDASGIDAPTAGYGVSAGDVDGDGWPDLLLPAVRAEGVDHGHRLWLNAGDGTFTDAGSAWLPQASPHAAWGATLVDVDADGDLDAAFAGTSANRFWRNTGAGFTEEDVGITGLFSVLTATWSAADFDADGDLDLYAVNHEFADQPGPGVPYPEDVLLRNRGDGTFEDASDLLPADRLAGAGFVSAWTDLDEDGDLDLYVVNDFGVDLPNQYFRNDGGTFTRADDLCACGVAIDGMGVAVGDYDGDQILDLYLSNRHGEHLLRNLGGQTVDTTAKHGALGDANDPRRGTSWGTDFLDFDRDGWPDLVLAFGDEFGDEPAPNRLFHNAGGRFEEVEDPGFDDLHDTRGLALLDFDRDGCTDLALRGPTGFELYRGRCPDVPWIGLELGTLAAGARVEVVAGRVQVHEVGVGSSSVHGSRDPSLRFALPNPLEEVRVRWPDGSVDAWSDLEAGRYHRLTP